MKIYYDFVIKNNTFSIVESATRISGSAYSALIKIETILCQLNKLIYQGCQIDVVRKSKQTALVIVKQYHARASKVHWLVPLLCCCFFVRKMARINMTYQRIKVSAS